MGDGGEEKTGRGRGRKGGGREEEEGWEREGKGEGGKASWLFRVLGLGSPLCITISLSVFKGKGINGRRQKEILEEKEGGRKKREGEYE